MPAQRFSALSTRRATVVRSCNRAPPRIRAGDRAAPDSSRSFRPGTAAIVGASRPPRTHNPLEPNCTFSMCASASRNIVTETPTDNSNILSFQVNFRANVAPCLTAKQRPTTIRPWAPNASSVEKTGPVHHSVAAYPGRRNAALRCANSAAAQAGFQSRRENRSSARRMIPRNAPPMPPPIA